MKTRERDVISSGKSVVNAEIDRGGELKLKDWAEVLLDRVHGSEVEVEHSLMIPNLKAETAIEYKGYQALIERAVDVFGDELIASRWLSTPSADLEGDVPLHVAQELGYEPLKVQQVFEPIFVRIEHGIYS